MSPNGLATCTPSWSMSRVESSPSPVAKTRPRSLRLFALFAGNSPVDTRVRTCLQFVCRVVRPSRPRRWRWDMDADSLGRRRQPGQQSGLRSMHPVLPDAWLSRALRVAMSSEDWSKFEALASVLGSDEPSAARAYGQTIAHLIAREVRPAPEWMDWERQKTLRLLKMVS